MSFILDALKKSEAQRHRDDAPTLYEMKMAPPRQGVPVWLLVLGGLLVINIGVLTVVLLRGNHSAVPTADTSAVPAPTPVPASPPPIAAAPPPMAASPAIITTSPSIPPQISTAPAAAPGDGDNADDAPAVEPSHAPNASPAPVQAPAPAQAQADPRSAGASGAGVPAYEQAASTPGASLPDLKLDYHQYDNNPARRVIFLNMVTLREGDTSPTGVHVESITPQGAILSWHGSRFFLRSN